MQILVLKINKKIAAKIVNNTIFAVEIFKASKIVLFNFQYQFFKIFNANNFLTFWNLSKNLVFFNRINDQTSNRSFSIFNPTEVEYSFEWLNIQNEIAIECLSPREKLGAGKRAKIKFKTKPEKLGVFENFWWFKVKKFEFKILFVLVIKVTEPRVHFTIPCIKFNSCVIGNLKFSSTFSKFFKMFQCV